jgi:hypothetical protein
MLKLLIRSFLLVLVAMGLYIGFKKIDVITGTIARSMGTKVKAVAGAHTSKMSENSLTKTVEKTVGNIEKQILNIKIGDIASAAGQLKQLGAQLNKEKDKLLNSPMVRGSSQSGKLEKK